MPIYVRKNLLSVSLDSLPDHGGHDEDFISDPDQMIDSLPQPFRLINKILTSICDSAWERISIKEAADEARRRQIIVPVYENVEVIDQYEDCPVVTESPDGKALFLGLPDDLIVLDPITHEPITSTHLEETEPGQRSELSCITTVQIDVQTCLIVSVSKSGSGRLHIYSSPQLLLIKELDTEVPTGSKILQACALNDGEFLGLTVRGKEGDIWLDILKLPKDNWLRALEDHRNSRPAEETNSSEPTSERGSPVPNSWNTNSLSKPAQVLRVTAPITTVAAAGNVTFPGVAGAPDGWMGIIGVGSNHQLTDQHLQLRRAAVQVELGTLGCEPKTIEYECQRSKHCSWLILNRCQMIGPGSVVPGDQYLVCSWEGTNYLCYYDLRKTSKDMERKPDHVVPFGADITALSASPCGILMTVGLSDGSVILYDEMVGLPLFVERVGSSPVQFLIIPVMGSRSSNTMNELNDLTKGQVTVIAGSQGGRVTALTLDYGSRQVTKVVMQGEEEELQMMATVKSLQNVLLTMSREGAVSLLDYQTGEALCRVKIPEPYSIDRIELDNILSLAASDQQILMKATVISDESSIANTALLAYKLQSFPCLDTRWTTLADQNAGCPTLLHTTPLQKRVDWLLNKHLQNSHTRQLRIQQRWEALRSRSHQTKVSA